MIAELRFIKSPTETKTTEIIEIIETIIMILALKKWLLKVVMILSLTGAALAAAII